MKIGVLCALKVESDPFLQEIGAVSEKEIAGATVVRGSKHGNDIFLCTFGCGPTAAAAAAQLLISEYGCGALLIAGTAGGTDARLGLNGAVIGKEVMFHDFDGEILKNYAPYTDVYPGNEKLVAYAESACRSLGINSVTGRVATGSSFICEHSRAMEICERTKCSCIDMESAGAAMIAMRNGVPLLAVRVISDNADESVAELKNVKDMPYSGYAEACSKILCEIIRKIK